MKPRKGFIWFIAPNMMFHVKHRKALLSQQLSQKMFHVEQWAFFLWGGNSLVMWQVALASGSLSKYRSEAKPRTTRPKRGNAQIIFTEQKRAVLCEMFIFFIS